MGCAASRFEALPVTGHQSGLSVIPIRTIKTGIILSIVDKRKFLEKFIKLIKKSFRCAKIRDLCLSLSSSCHLDRVMNVKIGVECQIFVIVIFFNCDQVLQFGAHSRYYKDALTQKRSFLVICITFRSDFHVS